MTHRRGRRCNHSKAVIQGVRCDLRHSRRGSRMMAHKGNYLSQNLKLWLTGLSIL
jgi:hypothetical protein